MDSAILCPPFTAFYHALPFSYWLRSAAYINMHDSTWDKCIGGLASGQAVCVESGDPIEVLNQIGTVDSVIEGKDTVVRDIGVILAIALAFKIAYIVGVIVKTGKVAAINK